MSKSFKKKMKKYDSDDSSGRRPSGKKRKRYDGIGPDGMPDKFFAQEEIRDSSGRLIASPGDFNLAQVQGEDARRYFSSLGLPMPDMGAIRNKLGVR